jgi:hypothetical protein
MAYTFARETKRMTHRHIALLILAVAALIWLFWPEAAPQMKAASGAATLARPTRAATKERFDRAPSELAEPQTIHSKLGGGITLRDGESCIFSYLGQTPSVTTLVEITPTIDEDGLVRTSMKIVEVADRDFDTGLSSDILPDLFEFERMSALSKSEMANLHSELAQSDAKVTSYPVMVSRLGDPVSLRSLVHLQDGTPLAGFSMSVTMNSVSEGIRLETGLDLYSQRPNENAYDD